MKLTLAFPADSPNAIVPWRARLTFTPREPSTTMVNLATLTLTAALLASCSTTSPDAHSTSTTDPSTIESIRSKYALAHSGSNTLNFATAWVMPTRETVLIGATNVASKDTAVAVDELISTMPAAENTK